MKDYMAVQACKELRDYCKEHPTTCEGCILIDDEDCCMFGTISPCEWVLPEEGE